MLQEGLGSRCIYNLNVSIIESAGRTLVTDAQYKLCKGCSGNGQNPGCSNGYRSLEGLSNDPAILSLIAPNLHPQTQTFLRTTLGNEPI